MKQPPTLFQTTTIHTSLRAISHPLSLAAIFLLLLNDHILKSAFPSVLTGKLSDFAGLFIFPFLLIFLLGIPFTYLRIPSRWTAYTSFFITLAWFTAIKTILWANEMSAGFAGWLLGFPVRLALDPTDLIGLLSLIPAWELWSHLERKNYSQPPRKTAYLAIGLATVACLATSPSRTVPVINRLVVEGQSVYAFFTTIYTGPIPDYGYLSLDDGKTWASVQDIPAEVKLKFQQTLTLPKQVCLPENPQECYRIGAKSEQVDVSYDGGQNWQVSWSYPPGRREFMQRSVAIVLMSGIDKREINAGPYDLAVVPSTHGSTVLIAMGNEGVLGLAAGQKWERFAVDIATPTPYADPPFPILDNAIAMETDILLILSLIMPVLVSEWGYWAFRKGIKSGQIRLSIRLCLIGFTIIYSEILLIVWWGFRYDTQEFAKVATSIPFYMIVGPLTLNQSYIWTDLMVSIVPTVADLVVLILFISGYYRLFKHGRQVGRGSTPTRFILTCLSSMPLLLFAYLPFIFWAAGWIPYYLIAAGGSVLIAFFVVRVCLKKLALLASKLSQG
jgi:hypothetical protein